MKVRNLPYPFLRGQPLKFGSVHEWNGVWNGPYFILLFILFFFTSNQ